VSTPSGQPRVIDVHCGWGASPAAPQWNDVVALRTALAARQQAADPVQELNVEVEALVLHPDLRAGQNPLDHAGEPEDRPEAQPQGGHPQARADHGHTLRRLPRAHRTPSLRSVGFAGRCADRELARRA